MMYWKRARSEKRACKKSKMKDCTREEQTEVFLLHWSKTETILGKDQAKSPIIKMNDTPAEWKNIKYT